MFAKSLCDAVEMNLTTLNRQGNDRSTQYQLGRVLPHREQKRLGGGLNAMQAGKQARLGSNSIAAELKASGALSPVLCRHFARWLLLGQLDGL
jgi:hypothetical protein